MALVLADRVKETTTTTGTGDISLGGAETNFVAFGSALSNADTTYYAIIDDGNADFEIGIGTYTSGTNSLSRDTILDSTNAGSVVNLGAGTKSVFITYPADKALRVGSNISELTNDSGFIVSATTIGTTAPVSPSAGDLWWNSESGQLKVYYTDVDGSQWVDAAASAANPSLAINDLTDVTITSATTGDLLQYDGTDWVNEAGLFTNIVDNGTESTKIAVGTTAQRPASPTVGDLRFNSDSGKAEVYTGTDWEAIESNPPISATGGTETTITEGGIDYKVHTFTSSGTFTVTEGAGEVEYLVVGGGGAGGTSGGRGGGGGAGGYRSSVVGESSGGGASAEPKLAIFAGSYTVTVGAGAPANTTANTQGADGSDSVFSTITSIGGGGGGGNSSGGTANGRAGGSGGGGATISGTLSAGGTGTANQGYNGGGGIYVSSNYGAGGGGGAGQAGANGTTSKAGDGGDGVASSITGSSVIRAGGGGGGESLASAGLGGLGGGGDGYTGLTNPTAGTANTGSGGGGGASQGAAGGSGIVIIRYPI